jgi:hypothetical protein
VKFEEYDSLFNLRPATIYHCNLISGGIAWCWTFDTVLTKQEKMKIRDQHCSRLGKRYPCSRRVKTLSTETDLRLYDK